jgi:amino acid adenylation domain-containing protein
VQTTTIKGFRLSPQQRRLWQLQQHTSPYPSRCVIRLEGVLDAQALQEAVGLTVERHEILRTFFRLLPGISWPVQVVAEQCPPVWQNLDLSDCETDSRADAVNDLVEQESRRINDLEQGPLVRFSLLRLAPTEHLLIVSLPALCADTVTLNNLAEAIGRAYESRRSGTAREDEALSYAQFSEWQNELLEDEEAAEGREFWGQQDLAAASTLALPYTDASRRTKEFEAKSLAAAIVPAVCDGLGVLAARWGVALEVLLHACWQTLLWRLTGQTAVITGQVFDGREHEVLKDALGLFAKWLPVQCGFTEGLRLVDVVGQVRASALAAGQWQEYFVWKQDATEGEAPARDAAPAPLFPFGFEFEHRPAARSFDGLSLSVIEQRHYSERFDLKLRCVRADGVLVAAFEYDAALFDAADVARLSEEFHTLLAAVVSDPDAPLSELEIVGEAERRQSLFEWNDTGSVSLSEKSLGELFEEQAERTPARTAVVSGDSSLTFGELNARANQLARYLSAQGVGAEARVGICMERSVEMLVALLGVLKAGAGYVPLDPHYPRERLSYMLDDAGVTMLLTRQSLVEILPLHRVRAVYLDSDWPVIGEQGTENPRSRVAADNLAYVIYTSGSTGSPKGVMVQHGSVVNLIAALRAAIYERLETPLNVSLNAPLAFDASVKQLVQLLSGHTLHVIPEELRLDAAALLDYMERSRLHVLDCTPSQLKLLLAAGLMRRPRLTLKAVLVGGEAIDRQTWKTLAEQTSISFYNVYGPTECTVDATSCNVRGAGSVRPVIGRPLANVRAYVLNGQAQPVAVGVSGELYVGGDGVARGYLGRPELTAEKFIPDPFGEEAGGRLYRTGDSARYLPDGQLHLLGRLDHQVKIHGFRIELGEIEAQLRKHAHTREAVVIVREDVPGDPRLVAYLTTTQKPATSTGELRQFLRQRLPDYMLPSSFVELEALPLTQHGKVDRRALPAPETARRGARPIPVAPRNEAEEVIARIWREVLQVEKVGVNDNFFDIGGHSLLVVQVHSRLREAFGVEVSIIELFKNPTVGSLAELFAEGQSQRPYVQKVLDRAQKRKTAVHRRRQLLEERNR